MFHYAITPRMLAGMLCLTFVIGGLMGIMVCALNTHAQGYFQDDAGSLHFRHDSVLPGGGAYYDGGASPQYEYRMGPSLSVTPKKPLTPC